MVNAAAPCSVPPEWTSVGAVSGLLTLSAPDTSVIVPARLVPALRSCVLVENSTVPPAPLNAPVWDPAARRLSVPDCACTVPVLWKAVRLLRTMKTPAPADLRNVPELLNVAAPPNGFCRFESVCRSQVPALLITAPVPKRRAPAPVQVTVADAVVLSVRDVVRSLLAAPPRVSAPFTVTVAAPLCVPADQV